MKRRILPGASTLPLGAMLAGPALARAWPSRPTILSVPFAAGGPTDVMAQLLKHARPYDPLTSGQIGTHPMTAAVRPGLTKDIAGLRKLTQPEVPRWEALACEARIEKQ